MSSHLLQPDRSLRQEERCPQAIAGNKTPDESRSPLERERLARRCRDEEAICGTFLHKFVSRSFDQLAALERAFDAGNVAELARLAQTLQCMADGLMADAMRASAGELEHTAKRGDLREAGRALVRTREEITRCADAAGELLQQLAAE